MGKLDPRIMLIFGFLSFAAGTFWMTYLTKDWDFWELFWPQVFRGVGLMMAMIPVNNIALGTLPPERVKNASGLFNLTRNLGGAVGLAALTTLLNDRTDLHLARLHEQVTWSRQPALEMLNNMTQRFSSFGSDAQTMALKQIYSLTHQQGVVMAFADVFLILTFLFVGLAVLSLVVKRPVQAPPSDAH
jgi:DHA2 family multidrug resistance protein